MAQDTGAPVFGPLIEQAKTGSVSLNVEPQAFLALDKALQQRKTEIQTIQQLVQKVHNQDSWGVGEQSAILTSAHTIVQRLRDKGSGGANNAYDTLQDHWKTADELQTLFRTIRDRLQQTDSEFAAKLRAAQSALPEAGGTQ